MGGTLGKAVTGKVVTVSYFDENEPSADRLGPHTGRLLLTANLEGHAVTQGTASVKPMLIPPFRLHPRLHSGAASRLLSHSWSISKPPTCATAAGAYPAPSKTHRFHPLGWRERETRDSFLFRAGCGCLRLLLAGTSWYALPQSPFHLLLQVFDELLVAPRPARPGRFPQLVAAVVVLSLSQDIGPVG